MGSFTLWITMTTHVSTAFSEGGEVSSFTSSVSVSTDQWHHVTVLWDSKSCHVQLYVGGVDTGTMTSACSQSHGTNTAVTVGNDANSGEKKTRTKTIGHGCEYLFMLTVSI